MFFISSNLIVLDLFQPSIEQKEDLHLKTHYESVGIHKDLFSTKEKDLVLASILQEELWHSEREDIRHDCSLEKKHGQVSCLYKEVGKKKGQ